MSANDKEIGISVAKVAVIEENATAVSDENQVAVAGSSNNQPSNDLFIVKRRKIHHQPSSKILDLDIDCLENLFEWISEPDLHALRETCTRFKRAVNYFIGIKNGPFSQNSLDIVSKDCDKVYQLDSVSWKLITELHVWLLIHTEELVNAFKITMENCTNLKKLFINEIRGRNVIGDDNEWLHNEYSCLEYVLFDDAICEEFCSRKIPELKIFFEKNPTIRTFLTTFHLLRKNRACWINSNINLDMLEIEWYYCDEIRMHEFSDLFNTLFKQGFYQRLHLRALNMPNQDILSVRGIEKLHLGMELITTFPKFSILSTMPELRELTIDSFTNPDDYETMAKNLLNVIRIGFVSLSPDILILFLRWAPRVKEIEINCMMEGSFLQNDIIDLTAMNNERITLKGACKITVYVKDKIFLATKWALDDTERSLVTLKRYIRRPYFEGTEKETYKL